ncbi:MAG: DUF1700 domain-containing protein [Lachnospiraceae bacterium]
MNIAFEKYLNTIDKHLKPLPTSERIDIVKEIKSSILEMEHDNFSIEQILERLGEPKELSKAYLGDFITKKRGFSWNRFLTICSFYGLTGFSGMFILPSLGIIAPIFLFCGIITPIAGLLKFICFLFGYNLPYIMFQFGSFTLHPALGFLLSIIIGIIFILLGKGAWKLLLHYIKTVSKTKQELSI